MAYIRQAITIEEIRADCPVTIWYSFNTCWWTHRAADLCTHPGGNGMPCDPRGGMLLMTHAEAFFRGAEANPGRYGKHGLAVFMASHNDNCVVSEDDWRSTCLQTLEEYNDQIDRQQLVPLHLPDPL